MKKVSRNEILKRIREAGIVGAGGAGFPTHVKYDANVEFVVANGAECEPLIRVDRLTMQNHPREIVLGMQYAMKATGASRGIIGLKAKYKDAIAALEEQIRLQQVSDSISLFKMDDFYPAGDEFILIREVLGRTIPEYGLPRDVGAVVSNVSTLVDVTRAVENKQPVITRKVTVGGAVNSPATFEVPVGTPYETLIRAAGNPTVENARLIVGGPMMGALSPDFSGVVTKTTTSLLILPETNPVILRRLTDKKRQLHLTRSACLKCMLCSELCPRNALGHELYPDRIMRSVAAGVSEDLKAYTGAYLCSECGLCATFACVMNLDPCAMNVELKKHLWDAGIKRPSVPRPTEARVFGDLRHVPVKRLVARLGLTPYDGPAVLKDFTEPMKTVTIPLRQHIGVPAVACVKAGDTVTAGQLIGAAPEDKLGANVHSSVAGRILEVTSQAVTIELI
ncbi:SLBB domain-containing protein [Myxococcota bacterium]|nr:SLBB domain-containing protein [Myxococcota bacterium]MBU1380239.1 SLBB domain-containing protein [Myxococcota bacterium]MBU1499105.1 SLBB domain-containing protein [Myxococcota bacterium]